MTEYIHDKDTGIQRISFKYPGTRITSFHRGSREGDEVTITLSTEDIHEQQKKKSAVILEKVHQDTKYSDVTFIFPETRLDSRCAKIQAGGRKSGKSSSFVDEEKFIAEQTLVAHKVILAQWPYFKAMFESDFAEGGSGHKKITVKDTPLAVFNVLLRYMYTETVPADDAVEHMYDNPLNFGNASWELIYLAADRYDIAGLREEAQKRLIANLDSEQAKEFLFRTAYLFQDLRKAVIEYIAKNCGQLFLSTVNQGMFKDHSEYATILGDIYDAYFRLHEIS
ncbi:hypothetical protein BGZ94_010065 [Podila epigama]|nr:hypothetical protein BGZ94_010065 [Podila epigama]